MLFNHPRALARMDALGLDALVAGVQGRAEADCVVVQANVAAVGLLDAGDQAHKRAFAGTVVAHDGGVFARHQAEIGVGQGFDPAVMLGQAADVQNGCCVAHGLLRE